MQLTEAQRAARAFILPICEDVISCARKADAWPNGDRIEQLIAVGEVMLYWLKEEQNDDAAK